MVILVLFIKVFDKKFIEEYHSTFFSLADFNLISDFLPEKISNIILANYNEKFDLERALKSYDSNKFVDKNTFNKSNFIENKYAFSSDNFFFRNNLTRVVDDINFNSRETLRIGQINTINYNLVFDKELRRSLPFYVLYKVPEYYKGSKICGEGNIYYAFSNIDGDELINLKFEEKQKSKCLLLDKNFINFYLFGFSINKNDSLKISLHKNFWNHLITILIIISKILFIILFYKYFFRFKKFDNKEYIIFFSAILSSIIFILLKDLNLITGLRYFRGGADGLFYESNGYEIVKNLYNFKFIEALRGGEDIFYFMPGLRYFIGFNKIIFGETNYGYVLISAFLPIFMFKFFKNIFSLNISFYLILSFMFFPIFENMGFGHFNYVGQVSRNHAETLSILLIIYSLYKITDLNLESKYSYFIVFYITLLLALSALCRPNFFPTTTIIFLYLAISFFHKNKLLIFFSTFGYSFVFLSLAHNIYFGNEFVIFTKSNVHFIFNNSYELVNSINLNYEFIINQFLKWNPLYNIHRILILIFIFYGIFIYRNSHLINMLFICMICQHFVLLLTHPDSRYAYLAWLLTFIIFIYFLEKIFLNKFKHFRNTL